MKSGIVKAFAGAIVIASGALGIVRGEYPEYPYVYSNYDEPYRPQFHFSPQSGWMNDVNGLWYYDGVYHMTYQHYPHGLGWAQMHWGAATSPDMLHWKQEPIAFEPGVNVPGDCFSGSVVVDVNNTSGFKSGEEDVFVAIYTATKKGTCLAYSNDKGATWQAYSGNPVAIGGPNAETRDPHVFWHAPTNRWVAAEYEAVDGRNFTFYSSADLKNWKKESVFNFGHECPDIFELAVDEGPTKKWVVMDADGFYHIGAFNGRTFTPDGGGPWRIDLCSNFYASQTFFRNNFPDDRVIQLPWVKGATQTAPWTHEAGFPCEIKLKTFSDGVRVTRTPIAEIQSLYTDSRHWEAQMVSAGSNLLSDVKAKCFDLSAEFNLTNTTATSITFSLPNKTVVYDISNKKLLDSTLAPINNRVKIRMLVDWGMMEVFGNGGRFSWTQKVTFTPSDSSIGLSVDGNVELIAMEMHRIKRIWPDAPAAPDFKSSIAGSWSAKSGTWQDGPSGKQGTGSGDVYCLSTETGSDFTYEADVTLLMGTAAALYFRANETATSGYCVNIDASGIVKLWAPGRGSLVKDSNTVKRGTTYHLKVVTSGARIKVYLDNGLNPIIDYTDATPVLNGLFGLNAYNGTATFQNVIVDGGAVVGIKEGRRIMGAQLGVKIVPTSARQPMRIQYVLPNERIARVSLQIFDVHGRLIRTLFKGNAAPGMHEVYLDLKNNDGKHIASGQYLCQLHVVSGTEDRVERQAIVPFFAR